MENVIEIQIAPQKRYMVKCDDCKKEIRRTNDIRESFCGGRCQECKGVN